MPDGAARLADHANAWSLRWANSTKRSAPGSPVGGRDDLPALLSGGTPSRKPVPAALPGFDTLTSPEPARWAQAELGVAEHCYLACAAMEPFPEIYSHERHLLAAAPQLGLNGVDLFKRERES